MNRFMLAIGVLALLICSTPAYAFEGGLFKGDFEISGRLGFSHSSLSADGGGSASTSDLELGTFMGVFLSDLIQLGGTLLVNYSSAEVDGGSSINGTMFGVGPDIVFNFNNEGPIVPFLDLAFAFVVYSGDYYGEETGYIFPSLQGGIRALIGNSAAANFGIGYARIANPGGVKDVTSNSFSLFVGFSVFP